MSATCLVLGLIIIFAAFTSYWPVQSGSHSFWGLPREGATCLAVRLMTIFAAFPASLPVQGGSRLGGFLIGKAATCLAAPRVDKMSKNESSQNEVLYIGKCSHTPGDHF